MGRRNATLRALVIGGGLATVAAVHLEHLVTLGVSRHWLWAYGIRPAKATYRVVA